MSTAIEKLLKAIDYPGEVSPGVLSYSMVVDGGVIEAVVVDGRLRLIKRFEPDVSVADFASYAAGRILREDAVLAWDSQAEAMILWQEISADAESATMRRFFEVFATSVDWWTARAQDAQTLSRIPEMMIRP